ncbi:MAG: DUF1573 domain-containing protein [Planctomycetes bacterium]|nr:DUF1573 domain-containing protein [Planctomycetota bacterium]
MYAMQAEEKPLPEQPQATVLELREHQNFKQQFTVTNPHDRAVRVERIDTTCSCIEKKLHKYFLLPGESTLIDVQVANQYYSGLRTHKIWLYVTDPELEAIEIRSAWTVLEDIAVDLIKEDPKQRPADKRYRDIYRYISNVKPDEAKRLKKYIRLYTPDTLDGGLSIETQYSGNIWAFQTKIIDAHTVLVIAKARDATAVLTEGMFQEQLQLTSNHPQKQEINLDFFTSVDPNAGTKKQQKEDFAFPGFSP